MRKTFNKMRKIIKKLKNNSVKHQSMADYISEETPPLWWGFLR